MSLDHLHLTKQICHRMYVVSNAATRAYRPHLDKLDLTYPQYVVMMALWEQTATDSATVLDIKNLQQKTSIDAGALTLILKKLTEKNFIQITKFEQDKRVKFVSLTRQGSELQQQAAAIPQTLRCKIPSLTDQELQQISTLLDKVIGDLV